MARYLVCGSTRSAHSLISRPTIPPLQEETSSSPFEKGLVSNSYRKADASNARTSHYSLTHTPFLNAMGGLRLDIMKKCAHPPPKRRKCGIMNGMQESPLRIDDLNLKTVLKGTMIICYTCGAPTETGVDILLGDNEVLLCGSCSEA